ncbi:MAG: diacylglycerol kinase [Alphaproteobacteria bacterium]|jgi:diacylglycerol kinase (ATP)|nr:diacylglycerol kinase [Alphaproteobacteria bacterium]
MSEPGKVPDKASGITRILRAFGYTFDGLKATFKSEAAFRQELFASLILIPVALYYGPNGTAKAMMIGSLLVVLVAEIINSAIEAVVNRFGPEWNAYAKHAKDAGSAAVFVACCNVGVVWLLCLFF